MKRLLSVMATLLHLRIKLKPGEDDGMVSDETLLQESKNPAKASQHSNSRPNWIGLVAVLALERVGIWCGRQWENDRQTGKQEARRTQGNAEKN
ncbi:MAG: hypothetical protein P4N60_18300 [Verrucomicrobiae bacterium]|nr:hypothetical protein [Verrucomicrobiae bacterium]